MHSYLLKKKISKICIFCAIPHTFILLSVGALAAFQAGAAKEHVSASILDILNALVVMSHETGWFADFLANAAQYPFMHSVFNVLSYALLLLGPAALIVSTVTCGTIGRVFRKALRAGLSVIRFCPVIVLTVVFFVLWFGIAWAVFCYVIIFMLLFPSVSIFISYRQRFGKSSMMQESVLV